jgi:hypothetical protein
MIFNVMSKNNSKILKGVKMALKAVVLDFESDTDSSK